MPTLHWCTAGGWSLTQCPHFNEDNPYLVWTTDVSEESAIIEPEWCEHRHAPLAAEPEKLPPRRRRLP